MELVDLKSPPPLNLSTLEAVIRRAFQTLQNNCHVASYNRGWWCDPITGLSLIPGDTKFRVDLEDAIIKAWFPYVIGTKIALIHSEVSEMLEAYRRDQRDDKINFPGITAEGADVFIRVFDLIGMLQDFTDDHFGYNLAEALLAKMPINATRLDHDLSARLAPGGKKF